MTGPRSITDIDLAELTNRTYTPSPGRWSDQVLYFVMLDRFSDGNDPLALAPKVAGPSRMESRLSPRTYPDVDVAEKPGS